jgi:hypothetical protein
MIFLLPPGLMFADPIIATILSQTAQVSAQAFDSLGGPATTKAHTAPVVQC